VAIALGIKRFANFGGDEESILVVDCEFVLSIEDGMLYVNLFPLVPAMWEYLPPSPTTARRNYKSVLKF
jgi:hypothetical protein